MNLLKFFTFALLSFLLSAVPANAATITTKHFEGGKNLTQGSKHGTAGTLADLVIALQTADAAATASISLKQNSAGLVAITCGAGAGGAGAEALTCNGLLATDTVLSVSQKTPGANSLPLLGWSTLVANGLTGVWSADPGAGSVVLVAVKR